MKLSRFITLVVLAGALALILSACGARSCPGEETAIARGADRDPADGHLATDRHTDNPA